MDDILMHKEFGMAEWNAWRSMCKVFGQYIEPEDPNDERFKPLFNAISKWGDEYAKLRVFQCETGRATLDRIEGLRFGSRDS